MGRVIFRSQYSPIEPVVNSSRVAEERAPHTLSLLLYGSSMLGLCFHYRPMDNPLPKQGQSSRELNKDEGNWWDWGTAGPQEYMT
jgi:hypothetical protein